VRDAQRNSDEKISITDGNKNKGPTSQEVNRKNVIK
jgi:hypothetical protein